MVTSSLTAEGPGFNFAAPSYFQRPDERVIVGTFMNPEFTDKIDAYTELMFMDTQSRTQFGPAGNFFTGLRQSIAETLTYPTSRPSYLVVQTHPPMTTQLTFLRADGTLRGAPVW